ncbi:indolepyruvate ferredoxin oxidoreductase subunit alpha [Candidatus Bathyarchaeota archaeon A05DMB-2]|jgi:indolepyruvate ferredoxin oxidoreductase alpha subunit|nr:indolepyruvate ferredoxin oxidoreductase subunit alpha [Candidatus Bathyarchaeota archaeon A05DMB-2]
MVLKDVLSEEKRSAFMLGNEAIFRGALEADVKVVAFYPGAPTSEILDTFAEALDSFDYQMEIATNEKVALEVCAGAAFAGVRSLTAMKSVGTNVASDTLFVLGYTGVKGGLVIVMADDPHAHSSQSEQDGRFFAPNAYIPMLEPSTPQEAKDMVKKAFEISERHRVPVLIRTVTRVNHQSGIVQLGELHRNEFKKVKWKELGEEYATLGAVARQKKLKMLERSARLAEEFETSEFNFTRNTGSAIGVVTSSVSYLYVLEALKMLKLQDRVSILKLGTTYPLPKNTVKAFIKNLKKVVVVEELSPYLEKEVYAIAKDTNPDLAIFGKNSGAFSEAWEYNPNVVAKGIASAMGIAYAGHEAIVKEAEQFKEIIPDRYPTFCAGCPHRATFVALNQALKIQAAKGQEHYFANDIGCYSMWIFPPISRGDSSLCMGASVGVANGLSHVIEERVVAVVGDSTFYHAAIPALIDAVHNGNKFTLLILDNSVTAMTGQQFNPSTEFTAGGRQGKKVPIEDICKAVGVEFLEVVDSYDVKNNVEVFRKALDFDGLAVVVSRRECALYGDRNKRSRGEKIVPFYVDKQICKRPYVCLRTFYCPAYEIDEDRQPRISPELCDGCSVCSQLCPIKSIKRVEGET